jgi:hypothetical protein
MPTTRRRPLVSLLALQVAVAVASAQPALAAAQDTRETYAGHAVVRVWPASARETLAASALELILMDEALRADGGTAWLASPEQLETLRALGIRFETILPDIGPAVAAERARLDAERQRWQRRADALLERADPDNPPAIHSIDGSFFDEFRPFSDPVAPDINELLDHLVTTYPALISRETIGFSPEDNLPIDAFTVSGAGNAADKPALIINGTAHAREWISPMTVLYIMNGLLEGYGDDPVITTLLDELTVHFIPVANPDGYVYSWTDFRFWRKTRRDGYGIDWNRNFPVGFGLGSSGSTSSDTYRGPSPFSEPETRAFRDFVLARPNIAAHVDYHSHGQLILYPWAHIDDTVAESDRVAFSAVSDDLVRAIASVNNAAYTPQQAVDLYVAGGTAIDWSFDTFRALSWVIELPPISNGGFAPPPATIRPTGEENLAGAIELMKAVVQGVVVDFPAGLPQGAQTNQPTPITVALRAAFARNPLPATARLRASIAGGPPTEIPLAPLGDDLYTAELPPAPCGDTISYTFAIDTASGRTITAPHPLAGDPYTIVSTNATLAFADDMEQDTGWTVGAPGDTAVSGIWERADPEPTDAQPDFDASPDGTLAWITGAAAGINLNANDVDATTTLTSPRLDTTPPADRPNAEAVISYARWYSNNQGPRPNSDEMPVLISNDDGQTWTTLETVTENAGAWVRRSFRVSDVITPTDAVRVRFIAQDTDFGSIVEAGVDDLRIEFVDCDTPNPADLAPPFGSLTFADITAFLSYFASEDPRADLAAPAGELTFADITAFLNAFTGR